MPRKTRMYLPGVPVHVVQRGNNRNACFFRDDDFCYYKELLGEGLRRYGGELHAYCLMTNHVHLLITPRDEASISRILQHLGRQYVRYVNDVHHRTGTLWEGRHKGCLIDATGYLITCYRYIERNPVAAGMVRDAGQYRWSSYGANAWNKEDALVTPHPIYLAFAAASEHRCRCYRALFDLAIPDEEQRQIQRSIQRNYPLGGDSFKRSIETALGRKIGTGQRGRPMRVD